MDVKLAFLAGAALAALSLPAAPALAEAAPGLSARAQTHSFAQARAAILAMAGDYKVRFDMQESTPWLADYQPLDRSISGGHESVRVIEDTGTRIVLQHLLVVEAGGQEMVIKHWRQDWEYEPERILAYAGPDTWRWQEVPAPQRAGAWAQTVWQVDDSPRYAGWGHWQTAHGRTLWVSGESWRPLARRDATRNPVYDRYVSINRHEHSPAGWIHWQDNTKMKPANTAPRSAAARTAPVLPVVQEYVLNTYSRFADYNTAAADAYWSATAAYWQQVRAKWAEVAAAKGGIGIEEEAETGTIISGRLLELADGVKKGTLAQEAAVAEAVALIERTTRMVG